MAELALYSGDVARLLHDVQSHGMARTVRGAAGNTGCRGNLVPNLVDATRRQGTATVRVLAGGQEKERRAEVCGVVRPLHLHVFQHRGEPLLGNVVAVGHPALLLGRDDPPAGVDVGESERRHRGAAHAGLDEEIENRPVAVRTIGRTARPAVLVARAVLGSSPDFNEHIRGIKKPPPFGGSDSALHLKRARHGEALDLGGRLPKREGGKLMDPFREGLEVGDDPVHRHVRPSPRPIVLEPGAEPALKALGQPRRPPGALLGALGRQHVSPEEHEVTPLHRLA